MTRSAALSNSNSSTSAHHLGLLAKRAFDIVFSAAGLVVLSPLLLLIAVLIAIDSRGGVFYRGVRTGYRGRPFRIFKFRTMTRDADRIGGPSTGKDDPRVTRIGRFLRRHKIDELPQLINVLRGEMSFVGPRPEVPQYTALYQGDEELILTVKPGITDYASLHFIRLDEVLGSENADLVYEEQVRPIKNALRVRYVKEWSFGNDLRILAATVMRLMGVDHRNNSD